MQSRWFTAFFRSFHRFIARKINLQQGAISTGKLTESRNSDVVGEVRTHKTIVQFASGQFLGENCRIVDVKGTVDG